MRSQAVTCCLRFSHVVLGRDMLSQAATSLYYFVCVCIIYTVFDLISEHTLISEHPLPFCAGEDYCQST